MNEQRAKFLNIRWFAVTILVIFVSAITCLAQNSTGSITVSVKDNTGAVISGASITVTGTDTGAVLRQVTSDAQGVAAIPLVPPGRYNIDVVMNGFKSLHRDAVDVQVGATASLDLALEIGAETESVTVTGETPLTEAKSQTIQQVIEQKEVTDIPLNGRNYVQAANFIPGAVPQAAGRDNSFTAYGNNGIQNAFLLDGARNVNYMRGLDDDQRDMIRPPLDALQEFTIQTSNYSAEFGASAGGILNAITKSGSDKIHGSAYEFMRNSAANAKDYFTPVGTAKAPLVRNQFGGSVGGPVLKDKLFYFGAFEENSNHGGSLNRGLVPTAAERTGDFSSAPAGGKVLPIYDPGSTTPTGTGTYTRTQFAGNKVPSNEINPIGQMLVNLYPQPNDSGPGVVYYTSNIASDTTEYNGIGRIDYTLTSTDSLFVRYAQSNTTTFNGVGLPTAQDPGNTNTIAKGIGVGYTRIFTPNFINNTRFAWTTVNYNGAGIKPRDPIINGLLADAITSGMPSISVQNFGGIGSEAISNAPLAKTSGVFDVAENLIWTHGKHLVSFGGEWMWIRPTTEAALGGRGTLGFTGTFTQNPNARSSSGAGLADLLLGYANSVTTGTPLTTTERGQYYAGYVNDQWTATQYLTLNVGARYEYSTPFIEINNHQANFVQDPGPLYLQYIVAGDPRLPRGLMYGDKTNIAPRLGFAYKVPHVNDLTVRGSFGIFWAQDEGLGITDRLTSNPPFYNYGAINDASDGIHTATGFALDPTTVIPQPTPVSGADFKLIPTYTGGLVSWPTHFKNGYVQEWSLSVEKKLPWDTLLEINYVGNHGVHLVAREQGNQPTVLNATTVQSRRPLAAVTQSTIDRIGEWNATQYQGMSAKYEKRFHNGISFRNSITYGHAFAITGNALDVCDTCGNGDTIQNTYDHAANWGPSDIDVRFRYTFDGTFESPFGKGKPFLADNRIASAALGNWVLSPIYQWQTGAPLTAGVSTDTANSGTLTRPNQICDPNGNRPETKQEWFNTGCLVQPANYTFGNMRVGTIKGPGQDNLDLSLQRNFPVPHWEGSNLNFRIEAFNALNHVRFSTPNVTVGASTYGQITSDVGQRQMQAAVRLTF
ncbi:carboxypeptidase regulatory-like domain-containing protein [Silvibacterium acidisoli]|uniref:carboxypeptidase regulatory-like domain-containing protein n=1 Tax=Acidobacteriaceae bacterium ZG23-2 TaxID=2883246 RepID=UPI00406C8BE2